VDRLLEIRDLANSRLAAADKEIASEKAELLKEGETGMVEDEDVWYLRRLDGGLFTLQTVDYILGWICMEDDGVRSFHSFGSCKKVFFFFKGLTHDVLVVDSGSHAGDAG
jgi:Catenin-beta-like, Arm-motif containing nuclear